MQRLRADDLSGIQNAVWIERVLQGAHQRDARAGLVGFQLASLGGADPVLVFHAEEGRALLEADPLPDHAIAIELHHIASVGLEVWLSAIAYGATGIVLLAVKLLTAMLATPRPRMRLDDWGLRVVDSL